MCPERLQPRGRARAGHMGDDGAEVPLVENVVPSTSPRCTTPAMPPRSWRKADGDNVKRCRTRSCSWRSSLSPLCYSAAAG